MTSEAATRERVPVAAPARKRSPGAQAAVATFPFAVLLLGYAFAGIASGVYQGQFVQGASNLLGFPLHVVEPVQVDRWLFGQLPTSWLQERFSSPDQPHWYDAVAAIVYLTHFVVTPGVAVVLWLRNRARFKGWAGCVLAMAGLGLTTYIVYPMAPPWLAAENGLIEPVSRVSHLGWEYLGLDAAADFVQGGQSTSNPVAAMPSLHVGFAVLVVAFFAVGAPWWRTAILAAYPVAMTLTVVYSGEHYVVDGLAGTAYAIAVVLGWRYLARRRAALGPRSQVRPAAAPAARASRG